MKNRLVAKKNLILLIILILLFNTGCWNRKELGQLGILGAVAIDSENDKIKLTYEVMTPKRIESKGSDGESAVFFQSEGKSMFDAVRNATLKYDKKLFWPHINVVFFNEKNAEKGMQEYLDFFNRDHDIRRYINLVVVKETNASEILGTEWEKGKVPSEYIESMIENNTSNGKTVSVKLIDFLKAYYADGIEPIVGTVQIVKKSDSEQKNTKDEKEENLPSIEGACVFKEDKLIGFLDGAQTRGYNFATNKITSGIIVSDSPDGQGINSVEIIKSSTKMDMQLVDGKYYGSLEINIAGTLGEETGDNNISSFDEIKKVEENTSSIIKKEVENSLKKVQEYNSDIFGFGQLVHRKYPADWKKIKDNWNNQFSDLEVEITVKTEVTRAGVSNQPVIPKEKN